MSNKNNRMVFRLPDGSWANKKNGATKASSVHQTQKEAETTAKEMLHNQGGGELTIKGRGGRIRDKNTVAPGNDPCPPKDKTN